MFPIAALGLVVAGFLSRIMMKISARRRPRIVVNHPDSDLIDDREGHDSRDNQSPTQRDGLTEYLQDSVIPTAVDSNPRRPFQDEEPDARGRDPASQIKSKISTRRSRRVGVDARESDWIDDQHDHELRDGQFVHQRDGRTDDFQRVRIPTAIDSGSKSDRIDDQRQGRNDQQQHVEARDELIDDLQSSLLQVASDYRPRHPLQADDGSSNDGRGKASVSPISDEIREREEVLERLRRDLDRLLRSPKVA
jgi:hypothetical protein